MVVKLAVETFLVFVKDTRLVLIVVSGRRLLAVICRGLRVRQWMIEFRVAASPPVASTCRTYCLRPVRVCQRGIYGEESRHDVLMHLHQ